MKNQLKSKKLSLHKSTLRELAHDALGEVAGGSASLLTSIGGGCSQNSGMRSCYQN